MFDGGRMNRRGVSPVIATVIIVAVAIAITVAVAFWMTGIIGTFTRHEELKITGYVLQANTDLERSGDGKKDWALIIKVKNTGTTDATLTELMINGKPFSTYSYSYDCNQGKLKSTYIPGLPSGSGVYKVEEDSDWKPGTNTIRVSSGTEVTLIIPITTRDGFTPGTSIEVKVVSASGIEYPKTLVLP